MAVGDNPGNSTYERENHDRGNDVLKELGFAKAFDLRCNNMPVQYSYADTTQYGHVKSEYSLCR